ncbi:MAG: hypothetical protein ACRD1W_14540 [Vicinamibacterales bacterium]
MRVQLFALTLIALVVAVPDAPAQTRATIIPSVSIGGVYDDNVSATARGDEGRMLQMRPSLEADYESPTVTLISLWSFDMQRSNHSSLNALNARQHAMFDAKLRSSTMTTWGVGGRYDRTDTPGEIDFESGVLSDRQYAQRWQVTPSVLRRIGQRGSFAAVYDFTTENLVGEGQQTLHVGRTALSRQLSPRASLSGEYIGRLFDDDFADHHSHAVVMGWTRELRQFTRFTVLAGPKWTSYRGLVPEVSLSLGRDGRTVKTGIDYSHGETIILGVPGPVQVDSGSARLTVVASRRVEFGVRAGASNILTLDERAATIYRGTLLGSWTFAGPFTLTGSYSADYQLGDINRNLFRDERVLRHVVRVGLTIAPSFSRSFLPPDEAARAKGVSR